MVAEAVEHDFLDRPVMGMVQLTYERAAWLLLAGLALWTRLAGLGLRAMSHDESMHAYYSYQLLISGSYRHDPALHGPLLYHLNALVYFLVGDSDFTARLVPALSGTALVLALYAFRRYLGRRGALAAGALVLISPAMLFYSRYLVLDVFVVLASLCWSYGAFRYLEGHSPAWLYLMVASMALHTTAKENAFIFGAAAGIFFLALALLRKPPRAFWPSARAAADLAVLMLTLVLPFLAPVIHLLVGWGPAVFQLQTGLARPMALVAALTGASIIIAWFRFGKAGSRACTDSPLDFHLWLRLMALFWLVQVVLFTTCLTNLAGGVASGIVGSLSYWFEQHGVQRGGAPWFYYVVLSSLYEFLPVLLGFIGAASLLRMTRKTAEQAASESDPEGHGGTEASCALAAPESGKRVLFGFFVLWWAASAWLAYSVAGERMPWLLVHIAFPTILLGGWWAGWITDSIRWKRTPWSGVLWLVPSVPFLAWLTVTLLTVRPFGGRSLESVQLTLRWWMSCLLLAAFLVLALRTLRRRGGTAVLRSLSLGAVLTLVCLTIRSSGMLNYQNYDLATELLVYAHATPDIKLTLSELEEIPNRLSDQEPSVVSYDDENTWPFAWYFRHLPGAHFYGASSDPIVAASPAVIVGPKNYDKVRPLLGANYIQRTRRLIWWPAEEYYDLTFGKIWNVWASKSGRQEIWQVIWHRRYPNSSLREWPRRQEFEIYLRKDIAERIWGPALPVGTAAGSPAVVYEFVPEWLPDSVEVFNGVYAGRPLKSPRGVAVFPNGTFVIADTGNDRIVMLDRAGRMVRSFGSRCSLELDAGGGCTDEDGNGPMEAGDRQFLEPWSVAASGNGSIYVADTWNSRIQAFDPEGRLLWKWGSYGSTAGTLADPRLLYGPRALAILPGDDLLVADTGNKRILRIGRSGEFLGQAGGAGTSPGRFNEPVGIAVDPQTGEVLVADMWNQRIQKLDGQLAFLQDSRVPGWTARDAASKPYLAVDSQGNVFATDPGESRVLVFDRRGRLHHFIRNMDAQHVPLRQPSGIVIDPSDESLWVADSGNDRILRLRLSRPAASLSSVR